MSRWRYAPPLLFLVALFAMVLTLPVWPMLLLLTLGAFTAGANTAMVAAHRTLHPDREPALTSTSLVVRQILARAVAEYQWQVRPGEFLPVDEAEALYHHDAGGEIRVRLHTPWARLKG